jgi:4-amino-4-deoxy-L-arabinose transferase-like glycosyltransferase
VRGRLADLDRRLAGWFTRRQGFGRLVSTGVFAALVGVVVILPLDLPARAPNDLAGVPILGHIAGLLAIVWSSAEHYAVLTVNAFNPWALVGPNPLSQALSGEYGWTFDSLPVVAGVPAVIVGTGLLVLAILVVTVMLLRRDDRWTIVLALTVLAFAFFVLPTRVHERYLFPVFAMGALLAATSVRWRWWYVALGLANFANLHAILTLPQPGYGTPGVLALPLGDLLRQEWAVVTASLVHAVLFGLLVAALVRGKPQPTVDAEAAAELTDEERGPEEPEPARSRMRATDTRASLESALSAIAAFGRPITRRLNAGPAPADHSASFQREGRGRIDGRDVLLCAVLLLVVLGMRAWRIDVPPKIYFDETFHARSGMEFLQVWRYGLAHDIFEKTHPHLAKYLMAAGLMVAGNDRVAGTTFVAPGRDAALQPAFLGGGDLLAVATGQDVRINRGGDIERASTVPIDGAVAVAFATGTETLFVGAADGRLWAIDAAGVPASQPSSRLVAQVDGSIDRVWVVGDGRLVAGSADGQLWLIDTSSGSILNTASVPGLAALLAIPVQGRTLLVAAVPEGIAELDPATLEPTLRVPLTSQPRGMDLADGSDFERRNQAFLSVPTLFVTTAGSRIEVVEVRDAGNLEAAGGFALPGDVRDLRWNRSTNMLHVLGSGPEGSAVLYTVEPILRTVFTHVDLPFEPAAWVLDVQGHEPILDRQRVLAFSAAGPVAVVDLGNYSAAWRLPGVVAGALMASLLYLLTRILFQRRTVALLLAILLPIEGLLFAQSRIAMNDVYVGLFIVAALTLLIFLLEQPMAGRRARLAVLVGLPSVGVLLGLALASKWVGAYAVGAAVLLVLIRSPLGRGLALGGLIALTAFLGWQAIAVSPANWTFLLMMIAVTLVCAAAIVRLRGQPVDRAPSWADPRRRAGMPFAWALVCLTLIPLAVYVLTFVPWAVATGADAQAFLDLQVQMYRFHDELRVTHGASSPWWAWPFGLKPVWGYYETLLDGTQTMVFGAGNPVLLWLSVVAVGFGAWQAWVRRSAGLAIVLILFLAAWLPWVRIDRFTLNYHYYVALPFALILLAYLLAELWHGPSRRTWALARVASSLVLVTPALLWVLKGPLCAIGGVDPGSAICTMPLGEVAIPMFAWLAVALVLGWVVLRLRNPRTLVVAIVATAVVVFVALYPALAAVRLPNGWPLVYQGLLPTWEGSFQFTSNQSPALTVPLVSLEALAILVVLGGAAWWLVRRGPKQAD